MNYPTAQHSSTCTADVDVKSEKCGVKLEPGLEGGLENTWLATNSLEAQVQLLPSASNVKDECAVDED